MPPHENDLEGYGEADPIEESRRPREPVEDVVFTDPATGERVLEIDAPPGRMIVADPTLDDAILALKSTAPDAFETFMARAVRKFVLYTPSDFSDRDAIARASGRVECCEQIDLRVRSCEQRVEQRRIRDAKRRERSRDG